MKNSNKVLEEAYKNALKDRNDAKELLEKSLSDINEDFFAHAKIGPTIAKYLESLARSNEQIIKIGNILNKKEENEKLSRKDQDELITEILKNAKASEEDFEQMLAEVDLENK